MMSNMSGMQFSLLFTTFFTSTRVVFCQPSFVVSFQSKADWIHSASTDQWIELSHIMTPETGHTPLFWDNMKYLLEVATSKGIYTPVDYSKTPTHYCGMDITDTPLDM